jgi:hypothetical protein
MCYFLISEIKFDSEIDIRAKWRTVSPFCSLGTNTGHRMSKEVKGSQRKI